MEVPNNIQPPTPPIMGGETSLGKLKNLLASAKERLQADPKLKRVLVLTGAGFGIIILLLVLAIGLKSIGGKIGSSMLAPSASPVSTQTPFQILNPSRYATDSGVLAIDASIKKVNQEMGTLTVPEYNLRLPSLDFDINFREQ